MCEVSVCSSVWQAGPNYMEAIGMLQFAVLRSSAMPAQARPNGQEAMACKRPDSPMPCLLDILWAHPEERRARVEEAPAVGAQTAFWLVEVLLRRHLDKRAGCVGSCG